MEVPWVVGAQAADGGLVVLLADLWGDAMYARSETSTKSALLAVRVPAREGPTVPLADMDVAEAQKDMDDIGCDSDSMAVLSVSSQSGESLASTRNAPAAPAPTTTSESVSGLHRPALFSLDGWEQISCKLAEGPEDRPLFCMRVILKNAFWSSTFP